MRTTVEKQLVESLGRHAESLDPVTGDEPIRLADVRSRARSIRRRRRVASGAGVAAVLALLVPVGVLGVNGWDRAETPPVATFTPTPIAEPITVSADVEQGPAPRVAWIDDERQVHLPDGTVLRTERRYYGVHLVAGRVLALWNDPDTGLAEVDELGPDGEVLSTVAIQGGLVVADDQSAAVWQTREGGIRLLNSDGVRNIDLELSGSMLDALEGGDDCTQGCVLWFGERSDGSPRRLDLDTLEVTPVSGPLGVDDVHGDGLFSGMNSFDELEPGSCSSVYEDLRPLWETCDYSLDLFSPDGEWVGATDKYMSGAGVNQAAVLDAETGDRLLEFQAGDGWFTQRVWEDESHLLAAHYLEDARTWQVFRLGLDGSVELAVPPRPGTMDDGLGLILSQ